MTREAVATTVVIGYIVSMFVFLLGPLIALPVAVAALWWIGRGLREVYRLVRPAPPELPEARAKRVP